MPNPSLLSPSGALRLTIETDTPTPRWSLRYRRKLLLDGCRLSVTTRDAGELLAGATVLGERRRDADKRIRTPFGRAALALDRFRELRLTLRNSKGAQVEVVARLYDDAAAIRYELPRQAGMERVVIADEGTSFGVAGEPTAHVQYLENYRTSHEHPVDSAPLGRVRPDTLLDLPLTLVWDDGTSVALTEAALRRYAGMALMKTGSAELACRLTPRDDGTKVAGALPLKTPWRVALVGERLGSLLESSTLYCLNDPSEIGDTRWIKPGKLTFSWWNGNLWTEAPTPGEPILSAPMCRRYIDFCARHRIRFHGVIADETDTPWYFQSNKGVIPGPDTDPTRVRADLDLAAIRRYADSKGIGLWTWVHQAALRGRVDEAFAAFERFGWRGMMVDFFDHDDQESVEHAEAILKAAARHRILIHLHGVWKPTGLQRTYPNLMNHEGALNLEYLKWSDRCTPEHTLRLCFTRLVAGPMDYHLGGFRAVPRAAFQPRHLAPRVLGSRAHHLAMYVCFDNPSPMVADYPTAYEGQPGFEFLERVPTWWDETRIVDGQIGELLVSARRSGQQWYVGALAAGPARDIEAPLRFLGPGRYTATIWRDSPETVRDPNRITRETRTVTADDMLRISVAGDGGGFVVRLEPAA